MDVSSTTSSHNATERNAHSERMHSSVVDSAEGLTENELLGEPSQDPEDEDTLSDDSLRLRLSDDEADSSQAHSTDVLTIPYISPAQTASQDTTIGCTDSNKECQRSKQRNQILSKTHVGGKKNVNSMWREGRGRAHSFNNTIYFPERSLRGHSFHARYNHCHSNIHRNPSYFNDHDNFGRLPSYHRYGSHWRHFNGRYLHGNTRNMQRNAFKERALKPESELLLKSHQVTQLLVSNPSPVRLLDPVRQASSNTVNNIRDKASAEVKCYSSNANSEKTLVMTVDKNINSLPSVNDELSKECSHLNLSKESTLDSLENSKHDYNSRRDYKNISGFSYDSQFTSDNWFDEPCATSDKYLQCSETSSSLLSQDSSNFQGVGSTSPLQGTESTVPSKQRNETAIDDAPLPQSTNLSSLNSTTDTTESDISSKLNDVKADSDTEIGIPPGIQIEINSSNLDCKTTEDSNIVLDAPLLRKDYSTEVTSSELCPTAALSEEMGLLQHQSNSKDEIKEEMGTNQSDLNCQEQDLSNNKCAEREEKIESQQFDISSFDNQEVAEQSLKIVTQSKDTCDDMENRSPRNVSPDVKRRINSDNTLIEGIECTPQKSRTFTNVEENESNKLLSNDTSRKSSDDFERNVTEKSSSKSNSDIENQPLLGKKRCFPNDETVNDKFIHKKVKVTTNSRIGICSKSLESSIGVDSPGDEKKTMSAEKCQEEPKSLHYVRKFFQRDMKGKLAKLKREELEELIIQKLVETITMRGEIGRLREQARISERNQEATRIRCQQLAKQIKDFDMVLNRHAVDRRANNDKPLPPIKINRSVGLQVNIVTDHSIQNLKSLSINNTVKVNMPNSVMVNGTNTKSTSEKIGHSTAVRRGLKVRSPRRAEIPKSSPLPVQPQTPTATPAALVVSKPAETSHNLSIPNNGKEQASPNASLAQPAAVTKVQNIVVNGKISLQANRQSSVANIQKPDANYLIDLTEEEDKNRLGSSGTSGILPMVGTVTSSIGTKVPHSKFQRVAQAALPGNVAITTQPANIRVVQSVAQPTPTALVNNINTTRLAYVMQGTPGAGRQFVIAPNPNQIRPATTTARGHYSNMTYKSGISTLANGNVRVITTAAPTVPNSQPPPAPLPDTPHYPVKNGLKLPPPPPSLKISKVTQGIVLSWNMAQSENYADIASYQLYAYQEIPGTTPNSNLWKKVGDVRALPLPMACTLKEFTPGNNYHFAVRAVDTHSRLGQYSIPRNISL